MTDNRSSLFLLSWAFRKSGAHCYPDCDANGNTNREIMQCNANGYTDGNAYREARVHVSALGAVFVGHDTHTLSQSGMSLYRFDLLLQP